MASDGLYSNVSTLLIVERGTQLSTPEADLNSWLDLTDPAGSLDRANKIYDGLVREAKQLADDQGWSRSDIGLAMLCPLKHPRFCWLQARTEQGQLLLQVPANAGIPAHTCRDVGDRTVVTIVSGQDQEEHKVDLNVPRQQIFFSVPRPLGAAIGLYSGKPLASVLFKISHEHDLIGVYSQPTFWCIRMSVVHELSGEDRYKREPADRIRDEGTLVPHGIRPKEAPDEWYEEFSSRVEEARRRGSWSPNAR